MTESRPVRCELTVEEADLLVEMLKKQLAMAADDELLSNLVSVVQTAQDHALERASVRGPSNDVAEYEW